MTSTANFDYSLIKVVRSKRRSICLQITQAAELIVRAPIRYSQKQIDDFVHINQAWIDKTLKRISAQPKFLPKQFQAGEEFLYLGNYYPLKIINSSMLFQFENTFLLPENDINHAQTIFIEWYKKQAHHLFNQILSDYARLMGLSYQKMKLSNARTRWGSCTHSGNIHLSWRLIMAPLEVITYVIVHELAHLREMNHSVRFWQLVGRFQPNYKQAIQWLRNNGHLLEL